MRYNLTIPTVFFLAVTALLMRVVPQKQDLSPAGVQKQPTLEQRLAELPTVDFSDIDLEGQTSEKRKARNTRYDSPMSTDGIKRPRLTENMEPVLLDLPLTHQPSEPALPITSDVIAIGTIRSAQAYLSSDRTSVYSEVTLDVEELLKGNQQFGPTPGTLTADRAGGAVRFGSGKILRRGFLGKNIPVEGRRYLLFLKTNPGDESLTIVTGYELREHLVVPLDGTGDKTEGFSQFKSYQKYQNASETTLVEDVRKAIANQIGSRTGGTQ
jgi:hypothetical protein